MDGVYLYQQQGVAPYQWSIYPTCVPAGCTLHVQSSLPNHGPLSDEPGFSGDARLSTNAAQGIPLWTVVNQQAQMTCPDGSKAPAQQVYAWDDATLTGTQTTTHAAVCGLRPGLVKEPFTLKYLSPLRIPVELYPLQCPTWPHCEANTVIPGELSPPAA